VRNLSPRYFTENRPERPTTRGKSAKTYILRASQADVRRRWDYTQGTAPLHHRSGMPRDRRWHRSTPYRDALRTPSGLRGRLCIRCPCLHCRLVSQGDRVAVLLRESGVFKSTGEAYSIRAVQWFTFADGKIKRIDEIVASMWKS
jgi:hypothetical protein